MRPELPIRIAFYMAEAAVLSAPFACGLLLLRGAARRVGAPFPRVTSARLTILWLCLGAFGMGLGELAGPEAIAQYYAAAAALVVGGSAWLISRFVPCRGALAANPDPP